MKLSLIAKRAAAELLVALRFRGLQIPVPI